MELQVKEACWFQAKNIVAMYKIIELVSEYFTVDVKLNEPVSSFQMPRDLSSLENSDDEGIKDEDRYKEEDEWLP